MSIPRNAGDGCISYIRIHPDIPPVFFRLIYPTLLPERLYCTIRTMDATVLIPIAFLVAGSVAVILTVYMYR